MDPQSPPKRMTRARAAAKVTEPTSKTTRVATAAAKARTARTATAATSTTTAAKRKTRSDDVDGSDSDEQPTVVARALPSAAMKSTRATRGRAKKTTDEPVAGHETEPERAAPVKTTRGRPKKVIVDAPVEEPVKATRTTRTKKPVTEAVEEPAEAPKRPRGRPPTSVPARVVTKPVPKKSVKFEEPEKENIIPAVDPKRGSTKASESTTGLRAKPVRKVGTAASRTTRGTKASSATGERPIPLSPKKVNQITLSRADSDDELAPNEKLPARPLRKNPIRPPAGSRKAPVEGPASVGLDTDVVLEPESGPTVILGSPIRKLPASPYKGSITSPPKRVEGVLGTSTSQAPDNDDAKQSPSKAQLLRSPAKRAPRGIKGFEMGSVGGNNPIMSPFKTSLLLSPAKRPLSPVKMFAPQLEEPSMASPAPKPTLLATPLQPVMDNEEDASGEEEDAMAVDEADGQDRIPDSPTRLRFPGRLSAVLPRHADPALISSMLAVPEAAEDEIEANIRAEVVEEEAENAEPGDDDMILDDPETESETEQETEPVQPTARTKSPKSSGPMFRLREKDLGDYDSETDCGSEDELAPRRKLFPTFGAAPATPSLESSSRTPKSRTTNGATASASRSTAKRLRVDGDFGFTPLAEQLNSWTAGPSPLKLGLSAETPVASLPVDVTSKEELSPVPTAFFEEAMAAQGGSVQAENTSTTKDEAPMEELGSPVLEEIPFTEEDIALAAEACEMSLMEPEQVEEVVGNHSFDDSISEASQEYGDENEVPVDPSLLASGSGSEDVGVPSVTPRRPLNREFHTISKVPLKPAHETPQLKVKKRSHSISRLPVSRPTHGLTRNATVISYSPTKAKDEDQLEPDRQSRAGSVPPVTPTKSEAGWSVAATPARTPRRDLDPVSLRGAVVFVDVHTSEGADASGIFVELLTQMGARCVKTWSWNPADEGASSKIGITHVVYKDGGKRTLEKVRESGGVVQCVGVSWVLDCERENQWLDEGPYYIDTAVVPRGGARRRKSMEPRAVANLNGMLVPTPVRSASGSGAKSAPNTPANGRRSSALWIRTPDDNAGEQDADGDSILEDTEWNSILTPVPKTPAPEAVARYAANLDPETPSEDTTMYGNENDEDEDDLDDRRAAMLTRTCPPKPMAFHELGQGILSREKDERVLMRLMAARRKSLQFAPKVASPLSKTWK